MEKSKAPIIPVKFTVKGYLGKKGKHRNCDWRTYFCPLNSCSAVGEFPPGWLMKL
jgi:hypothetical protein